MKNEFRLIKAFGENEYGFADLPEKISSATIARFSHAEGSDCYDCFPKSCRCTLYHRGKQARTWKKYRKTQYKPK